jgi:hypothetical protein
VIAGNNVANVAICKRFSSNIEIHESNFRHFWCFDNSGGFIVLFSGKKASLFYVTYFSVCLVGV